MLIFILFFGPSNYFKFIIESEVSAVRRPLDLAVAYTLTKTGLITPDYLYVMGGVQIPLPFSTFLDAGIYFETSSTRQDYPGYHWKAEELVPFSQLDFKEGFEVGGYISGGLITAFGRVSAELYISNSPRISFMVGLE